MAALARAVAATREWPSLWIVALCGFLARGGIVVLVLPMIPVPSTVGMATFVGPTSVTAAGLTADSVARIALLVGAVVAWLVVGNLIGAVTDIAVVGREVAGRDGAGERPIVRLIGLRLFALLPLIAVTAVTARSIGELVYQELILPSDIAAPIVLRVVQGAQLQVAVIVLAWVVGEALGGIAVRLTILEGRPFGRALAGSLTFAVRHLPSTLGAIAVSLVILVCAIAPGLLAIGAAWSALGDAVSGTIDGGAVVRATVVLVAAWVAAASLAAIGAAWRTQLWTATVAPTRKRD